MLFTLLEKLYTSGFENKQYGSRKDHNKEELRRMKTKDDFLEGAKVTKDNQIYGTPNSKSKDGTGNSPNDDVGKNKHKR